MVAGLQVFDGQGNITLNLADRVPRFFGAFNCPGAASGVARNYTYQMPASVVQQGDPIIWHTMTMVTSGSIPSERRIDVTVSSSGVINVSLGAGSGGVPAFNIFFGVY